MICNRGREFSPATHALGRERLWSSGRHLLFPFFVTNKSNIALFFLLFFLNLSYPPNGLIKVKYRMAVIEVKNEHASFTDE
jgi:hypothetical protein